jgi:hypothetical protein
VSPPETSICFCRFFRRLEEEEASLSWIHNETKSCRRCSNPIEVLPIPALCTRPALALSICDAITAEKWRLQPHEVRALFAAFLLALYV